MVYEQYMTIFEQSNDIKNMCILSSNVINNIIRKHDISNGRFESMHVTNEIQNLSLLFNMSINSQILKDFLIMGNLKK
jgi:hypothetical protein